MSSAQATDLPAGAGPGRVLGTLLVLALFLGGLFWIGKGLFVSGVDGAAKQREYFGERALPFGLALDSAVRLPGGDALVRFARAGGDSGPTDAIFLELESRGAAEAMLRASIEDGPAGAAMRLKEWERDKAFGWHMTKKRGDIQWGEWSSKLLIERSYAKGGGWKEEARVNLSAPTRALVLLTHWPAETPVDEQALRELLAAVVLAPPGA
ncbi:MAG: hypothetical protein HOP15_10460 [Planctomycetes bacterium]|nr:hypothetical protein [Planctomycetota bacterium]